MLAIRMQRTGRKGHAQFRLIVQESRRTPSSGNVVAALGSYDPHSKAVILDKEKAATYLNNGAQPSPRVAMLLQKEGIKLPSWVKVDTGKQRAVKHTEKLRRNQTAEPVEAVVEEAPTATEETPVAEAPAGDEIAAVTEEVAASEETPVAEAEAEDGSTAEAPAKA